MKVINLSHLVLLLGASILFSCGSKTEESTEVVKPKIKVETAILTEVQQSQEYTATIQSDIVNKISPAVPARIRTINVEVGDRVRKGQILVTLDKTSLSQSETQIANLERDLQRYKELYEVGGISKQQLDQAKTQLDVAETAMGNLGENTRLVSPLSGVVTARNYDPGDVAMQLPILTIESLNPVKVTLSVSERYYSEVTVGMPVEVQTDALGDEVFQGKISLIYPTIDPVSHTFTVEVTVPNGNQRLRPGMFARVRMNFGSNERPLLSDMAVLKQVGSNDRYVFVEENGKAVYTLVQLGVRINDKYEILSGLNAGDRVIIHGNTNLIDGSEVEVID